MEQLLHTLVDWIVQTLGHWGYPGIRQYISLPTGIACMNLPLFAAFTGLGAGLWVIVLALVSYCIGNNQELVTQYLHQIALGIGGLSIFLIVGYVLVTKKQGVRNG